MVSSPGIAAVLMVTGILILVLTIVVALMRDNTRAAARSVIAALAICVLFITAGAAVAVFG